MAQIPTQVTNAQSNKQPQIIQVGQNSALGQMVIAQPATTQQAAVVTATSKGKARTIKSEAIQQSQQNFIQLMPSQQAQIQQPQPAQQTAARNAQQKSQQRIKLGKK
jgi:hypothetical protein